MTLVQVGTDALPGRGTTMWFGIPNDCQVLRTDTNTRALRRFSLVFANLEHDAQDTSYICDTADEARCSDFANLFQRSLLASEIKTSSLINPGNFHDLPYQCRYLNLPLAAATQRDSRCNSSRSIVTSHLVSPTHLIPPSLPIPSH